MYRILSLSAYRSLYLLVWHHQWPLAFQDLLLSALVIVQPTKCGMRRLVAAFRSMRRRVAALQKLTHFSRTLTTWTHKRWSAGINRGSGYRPRFPSLKAGPRLHRHATAHHRIRAIGIPWYATQSKSTMPPNGNEKLPGPASHTRCICQFAISGPLHEWNFPLYKSSALVIVQPTKCGVRRHVAAFRAMRRQVAALHKLALRLNEDQGQIFWRRSLWSKLISVY